MSRPRDPSHMSAESTPSAAELEESERLFADLRSGDLEFTSDPTVRLLRSARGPATPDELIGADDFAEHVAVASGAGITARHAMSGGTVPASWRERMRLIGRALAAKAALIAGIGVLGVAGAGAASGVIIASHQQPEPSTTETLPGSTVSPTTAGTATTVPEPVVVPTSTTVTTSIPPGPATTGPTLPEPRADGTPLDRPSRASPSTSAPTTVGASSGEAASAVAPAKPAGPHGNPTPGANGAANGAGVHAGGNATPDSTGAAHRNPDPAGKAADGHPGAVNGNGAARSGKPAIATP